MPTPDILFYLFAGLTLLFGFLCVANPFSRNPVTSAMFLVLTMISISGLFVLLQAFFLAAVQILVYAGAVMVLFLFVIMLLDLKAAEHAQVRKAAFWTGICSVTGLGVMLVLSIVGSDVTGAKTHAVGETKALGRLLFTNFLLPFEVVSILLLVAMIGVILLSRKEAR
ncbi:MAG: NADH-quinone oxidoreductase subunit J [Pedosphaera sp.]|nr:NADH-quinone oxidoreductase subunit J [Pedosphaera sp.]